MRVLLDTNLWSYLGDQDAGAELAQFLRSGAYQLVLAPCVLLEVLTTPRVEVRNRIIKTMTKAPGERLRTEVDLEADEIIREVRRLHPEWLRQVPDRAKVTALRIFWTRTLWRRSLDRADIAAHHLGITTGPQIKTMIDVQRSNQSDAHLRHSSPPIGYLGQLARPSKQVTEVLHGWDQPAEVWRLNTALRYQRSLRQLPAALQPRTEADWVGAFIDLKRMFADRIAAVRFFLEEIELHWMPRNWLHNYAVEAAQLFTKVGSGNPIDQQLAAHLLDCDVLLTADKRLHRVITSIRAEPGPSVSPTALTRNAHIDVVSSIQEALAATQTRRTDI